MKPPTTIPEPVARVAELMASFGPTWYLCGGWAVDSWLGRQTRQHGDIDITIFESDQRALFDHLSAWQLIAHDKQVPGNASERWNGRRLTLPAHIHGRPPETSTEMPELLDTPSKQGFDLEIVLNQCSNGGDWLFIREPLEQHGYDAEVIVSLPLNRCVEQSGWGLPAVTPEVLLFYKATAYAGTRNYLRRRDHLDFEFLLPHLTPDQRSWLTEAISLTDPNHPWLGPLSL